MSVHRRGIYTRNEITILQINEKERLQEIPHYTILPYHKDLFQEKFLVPTANVIILNLIWVYNNHFLDVLQFEHAIDKVITYARSSDLLAIEDIFFKLNKEVVEPYLHTDFFIAKEV